MKVREHVEVTLGAMVNMRCQDNESLGPGPLPAQKLGGKLHEACLRRVMNLDREKMPLRLY